MVERRSFLSGIAAAGLALAGALVPGEARAQGNEWSRVASAIGKEVRVTAIDGSKETGTLLLLSDLTVTVRRHGQELSIPLEQVRTVEKTSHGLRNGILIGTLSGGVGCVLGGVFTAGGKPTAGELCPQNVLFGVGVGAGIGAIVDAVHARRNLIYQGWASSSMGVAPVLSPQRQGIALTMRW